MQIIGIAGGSGSGKSTVAWALVDSDPHKFQVLNFDDYQKLANTPGLPTKDGMINWDHPDIIRWEDVVADINKLRAGQTLTISSKDHRLNPDYNDHHQRVDRLIEPRPVLLVEGHMALHRSDLAELYDKTVYLDLHQARRHSRRDKQTDHEEAYKAKILKPMHDKYVEPTKAKADVVIDVSGLSVAEVRDRIKRELKI